MDNSTLYIMKLIVGRVSLMGGLIFVILINERLDDANNIFLIIIGI